MREETLDVQMVLNLKWRNCFYSVGPILNWSVKLKATEFQDHKHEQTLAQVSPKPTARSEMCVCGR